MSSVHYILDEAAMLGHMESIDDALGIGRGYGIRLIFAFQSQGQIRKCFPEGQDVTFLSNVTQIYFAVNDNATADYVSARLGEETIVVNSGGTSGSRSRQLSFGSPSSSSYSDSTGDSHNWQFQARKLLKPEEIAALPQTRAISFVPGVRPIQTDMIRYYEEKSLAGGGSGTTLDRLRRILGCAMLLVWFTVLIALAACLTLGSLNVLQGHPILHLKYSLASRQREG